MDIRNELDFNKPKEASTEFVTGFSLTGEYVKSLEDKHFTVMSTRVENVPDLSNPSMLKQKTILKLKLANGVELDYFPNKTSMRTIINKKGYRLQDWTGYTGMFYTASQRIAGTMREVIYIQE